MNKTYELWLDESGNFENESNIKWNPSLVGGVLIEQNNIQYSEIRNFFESDMGHACELDGHKADWVIPALRYIKKLGGNLVCFENKERLTEFTSRVLYLRIFASGIVQLLRDLSAKEEAFTLNILVALRVDTKARRDHGEDRIPDAEYLGMMREYVRSAVKQQTLELDPETTVNIVIGSARKEDKLKFADYVCNARLTRNSSGFHEEERLELAELFGSEFLFGTDEQISESWIKAYVAEGDAAAALLELHFTKEKIDYSDLLELILEKMKAMSYRIVKLQLQGLRESIRRFVAIENDFEYSEKKLTLVIDKLLPRLKANNIPFAQEFEFDICLYRTDLYLREGDIINAKISLERMKAAAEQLDNKLEYMLRQYQMIEKDALYDINCFDFKKASRKMNQVAECIEHIMLSFGEEDVVRNKLSARMQSEYLGDALCMKLYADMFLQRQQPEIYNRMIIDSDKALSQYKYEGELERNQQYRSHIEMEQGEYQKAFTWLLRSALIDENENSLKDNCRIFLERAWIEDKLSRCYYLMYYCEIMAEAMLHDYKELADSMYEAILKHKNIWGMLKGISKQNRIRLEREEYNEEREHSNILEGLFMHDIAPFYHPMEIVYWKLGTYQSEKNNHIAAEEWYGKALDICKKSPDYLVLHIVELGILSEQIYYNDQRTENNGGLIDRLRARYQAIMARRNIEQATLEFVRQWEELMEEIDETELVKRTKKLSRLITF